jgi:hypothetical protein
MKQEEVERRIQRRKAKKAEECEGMIKALAVVVVVVLIAVAVLLVAFDYCITCGE